MSTALSKGEKTRQKIVHKAAVVFNQHGYSGTSLSDLMEKTGLEKGGIYRHFESKEDLAVAAFDYAWNEIKNNRLKTLDGIPTSLGKLHGMINVFASKPSSVPGGCVLMNTAIDADDGNPVLRAHARQAMSEWRGYLEEVVRKGIEQGEIDPATSGACVATVIIATLEGSFMISRLIGGRDPLNLAREHLHKMVDGIARK